MKIASSQQGAVGILALQGPLLKSEVNQLDAEVQRFIAASIYLIVLDLEGVPLIDSIALEKIWSLVSDLGKRGGDLRVAALCEVCSDIFRATRMDSIVACVDDVETAVLNLS